MKIGVAYPSTEIAGDPKILREFIQALEVLDYDHMMLPDHVVKAPREDRDPPLNGFYDEKDSFAGRVRKWRGVVRRACGACQTIRFHSLLIEPDVQISRIRLSDKISRLHPRRAAAKFARRTRPKRSYSSGS